jgi:cystathionine gamma-synthase
MRFETLAVHAGAEPDAESGAIAPPLHLSTTFLHAADGQLDHGWIYQRYDNPTQARLEEALAALDCASRSLFFSTGMAAASALLQALPAGGNVIFPSDLYHGIRVLAQDWLPRWGLQARFVDATDLASMEQAIDVNTRLIWLETPSNPLLTLVDIAAIAVLGTSLGVPSLVDNTFASPVLQSPLALGADIVLHSATKYIGGHSDVMGGVLSFSTSGDLSERCFEVRKLHGASANPFASWLVMRGLRSLPARMRMHCENAMRVARWLSDHTAVSVVHYPGLPSHPQHTLATRQMRDFGGMLSFELQAGRDAAIRVAAATRLFHCATSLGGCESLVEHRASVEGAHPTSPSSLLRLSVGLEHADDLIDDLAAALKFSHG